MVRGMLRKMPAPCEMAWRHTGACFHAKTRLESSLALTDIAATGSMLRRVWLLDDADSAAMQLLLRCACLGLPEPQGATAQVDEIAGDEEY